MFFELAPGLLSAPKDHYSPGQTDGTKNGYRAPLDLASPGPRSSQLSLPVLSYCQLFPLSILALPPPLHSAQMPSPPTSHRREAPADKTPSMPFPELQARVLWSQGLSMCPQEKILFPSQRICSPPLHPSNSWMSIALLHPSFFTAPLIAPSLLALTSKHTQVSSP